MLEAPRKRPGGVTLVAVLVGIQGICRVLVAVFFLLGALLGGWALTTSSVVVGVIAGILAALVGLVTLYFAWGLWTLKRWAYWATVILMVLDLLGSVFEFTQPITGAWTIWGGVIIPDLFLLNVGNSLFLLERKQYIAQIDYVASNRVCASLFPASAKIVCSEDVRLSPNGYTANSDELLFHRWELYLSLYD